ncbi:hypothetical protein Patl1_27208 [Pistacia atlantica]|uniref:Uncharacterized protein n=1 Tax=Pistacia atlantica TaxID=434234 RepID=A0ACC1BGR1_9ROSI|nr:hypothetical protein Patl1_27208 [Pistacia atlantica]
MVGPHFIGQHIVTVICNLNSSDNRKHTVEFLISKGATPGILFLLPANYHREKTPADLAFATGHKEICDYLEEKVELAVASLELL